MILHSLKQRSFDEVLHDNFDIVICASGYESRATVIARELNIPDTRRITLGFAESTTTRARKSNDALYRRLGYRQFLISGSDGANAETIMQDLIMETGSSECKMLIDISSMTRAWYGSFIRALRSKVSINRIEATFAYVPAAFPDKFSDYPPNEVVAPVRGFAGLSLNDKPTALIIGLGNEEGRAIGIKEELDPDLTIAFYAHPSIDKRYEDRTKEINADLIESIDQNGLFCYPLTDTLATFAMLESLCTGLLREFNIVLTSLGPKIFGLCCLLLSSRHPEISVWRVSAGTRGKAVNIKESDHRVILDTIWKQEDY